MGHINVSLKNLDKIKGKFLAINLSAIGEPLMNPNFMPILKKLREKCYHLTFTSNFVMLNDKIAKEWIEIPVDTIYVSIDAAEAKVFEKIRKGAKFNQVLKNVKLLQDLKDKKKKPKIIVRFCPTTTNINQMKNMPDLLHSLNLKELDITVFLTQNRDTKKFIVKENIFLKEKEKTIAEAKKHKIKIKFFKKNQKIKKCRTQYTLMVTASGEILPCCFLLQNGDYNESINKYSLGNIYKNGLKTVWNSKEYKQIRKDISNGKLPKTCIGCEVYNK